MGHARAIRDISTFLLCVDTSVSPSPPYPISPSLTPLEYGVESCGEAVCLAQPSHWLRAEATVRDEAVITTSQQHPAADPVSTTKCPKTELSSQLCGPAAGEAEAEKEGCGFLSMDLETHILECHCWVGMVGLWYLC